MTNNQDIISLSENLQENYSSLNVMKFYDELSKYPVDVLFENVGYIIGEPTRGIEFMLDVVAKCNPNYQEVNEHLLEVKKVIEEYEEAENEGMVEALEHYSDLLQLFDKECEATTENMIYDLTSDVIKPVNESILAVFLKPAIESLYGNDDSIDNFYNKDNLQNSSAEVLASVFPHIVQMCRKALLCSIGKMECKLKGDKDAYVEFPPFMHLIGNFSACLTEAELSCNQYKAFSNILAKELDFIQEEVLCKYCNDEYIRIAQVITDYVHDLTRARQCLIVTSKKKDIINDNVMSMQPQVGAEPDTDKFEEEEVSMEASAKPNPKFYILPFFEMMIPKNWNSPVYDGKFKEARGRIMKKIDWCKKDDDIKYLQKDSSMGISQLTKLRNDLEYALKNPDDNKSKYVELRKRNKKGLTVESIDEHIKWIKEEYNPAIIEKKKSLHATKEAYIDYLFENDDLLMESLGDEEEDITIYSQVQMESMELDAQEAIIRFATCESISNEELIETFKDMLESCTKYSYVSESVVLEGEMVRKASLGVQKGVRKVQHGVKQASTNAKRAVEPIKKTVNSVQDQFERTIDKIKQMDMEERREKLIKGGVRANLKRIIRAGIVTAAVNAVGGWWYAAVALIGQIFIDKKIDHRIKKEVVDDIDNNMKLLEEKIDDAKSEGNKQAKYQLMRQKAALEKESNRIRYSLPNTHSRDTEIVKTQQ